LQAFRAAELRSVRIAKPTPRGWRLVKASESSQVDALIGLAMAADRADRPAYGVRFLGWS